jgi:hypothetical protein
MTQYTEDGQLEINFFLPGDPGPSKEVRASWADPEDEDNPLRNFIGNQHAVRRLCRVAFDVYGRYNRQCNDHSVVLIGPPSTGKATLARMFCEHICLPFVEINGAAVSDVNQIAVSIAKMLEETKIENCQYKTLELQDLGGGDVVVPPCMVVINNVHALPTKVEHGVRQATAGRLETNGWKLDTTRICWIIATTLLPDGFDRFTTIRLKPLSVEEVAQVMALNFPDLPAEVSLLIAQHAPSPRDALAFAEEMRIEWEMHGGDDWREVAAAVAKDWGVTPWKNRVSRNGRH